MLIGGLDVGTTGCKITVYDDKGNFIHNEYKEYEASRKNGEHEIDANEIFLSVCHVIKATAKKYSNLSAIGVTTFGETFAILDDEDNVLLPSMLYTDPRGREEVEELCKKLGENKIIGITGAKPNQMYSIPKIMWIKRNKLDIYNKIKKILLIEDFIVYKLSGVANIDYSMATRTLAFDIRKKEWSKEIFDAADIDINLMSTPVKTGSVAGKIKLELAQELGVSKDLLIVNGCQDQIAAAVGAGVFEVGQAVDGTGTVECVTPMFDRIPENTELYNEGYSVVPYVFDNTYVCYAFSFTGGAAIKWYRDNFAKYESKIAEETGKNVYAMLDEAIPQKPTDILIMPHFAGAATPYMDNGSRAAIIGLTLEHTNYDIYKALMEGVTYEIMLNIERLEKFGINLSKLVATGGGATSEAWLKIKADILNRPITALEAKEAGSCGTCMLTAVGVGACRDLNEGKSLFVKEKKEFSPEKENTEAYRKNYNAYRKIYQVVRPLIEEI